MSDELRIRGAEDADAVNLRLLARDPRYSHWQWQTVSKFLGQRVLEAGAGLGTISQYLLDRSLVVLAERNPTYLEILRKRFGHYPKIHIEAWDLSQPRPLGRPLALDTVLCLNVLEHLADDECCLQQFQQLLAPGGVLVALVPAHQWLYGYHDWSIGHLRRYSRRELTVKLRSAGFTVERIFFFNALGAIAWFWHSRVRQKNRLPGLGMHIFSRLVPLLARLEKVLPVPFGLSLIAVGRKSW